ncbi:MAG TPA: ornithine carbamoyltransferase [Thermopetrobacter sp.]|nr:ornithine carbamoyltransferase [Thermopetrobacter sp.]
MTGNFLDIRDFSRAELLAILDEAARRKAARAGRPKAAVDDDAPLAGRMLAMVFEKPSTRTRVSFDVAMRQLGGETMVLNGGELQLGRGETVADTARVLSRMVDAVMIRTFGHERLLELARAAGVPVINGLTDLSHPCQIMADAQTIIEHRGRIEGVVIAWVGDCANVTRSWIEAATLLGATMRIAAPAGYGPDEEVLSWATAHGGDIEVGDDPHAAVRGADVVMTDTWISMHHGEEEKARRMADLTPYQVNAALMGEAGPEAIFMHCLPAHRGEEVTDEVIDGPRSVVFDEAENRIHAQKAILVHCLRGL